jgi:hypothetical protein
VEDVQHAASARDMEFGDKVADHDMGPGRRLGRTSTCQN